MKHYIVAVLSLTVMTGLLLAADTRNAPAPGTDDLSRYVAVKATPGAQTTLRDASGRTLGTASSLGSSTTVFRDRTGRTAGTAVVQGRQTVFRDAAGRTVWTATTSGSGNTVTYRDAAGRIQRTASASGSSVTFRDAAGRTTSTLRPATSSVTARDASGRTQGTSWTTGRTPTAPAKPQRR